MSSLWLIPLVKVLAYTYRGDVPISPYTIPMLWNASCKITDQLEPFRKTKKKMKLDDNHFVQRRNETISILEDLGQ
jgi:hypothetical protein